MEVITGPTGSGGANMGSDTDIGVLRRVIICGTGEFAATGITTAIPNTLSHNVFCSEIKIVAVIWHYNSSNMVI